MLNNERHTPVGDAEWALSLQKDIDENGMQSPLIVDNTNGDFKVVVGTNRVVSVRNLGWTHVPCIIWGGPIPDDWDRVIIRHEHQCREYVRDGRLIVLAETLMIRDAHLPESMKYPTNPEPYLAIKEQTDSITRVPEPTQGDA
jgi:hypothetical protein